MEDRETKSKHFNTGALLSGFSASTLPPVNQLIVGKRLELYSSSGKKSLITFFSAEALKWEEEDRERKDTVIAAYTATCPRSDIYFIDFVVSRGENKSLTVILDRRGKFATLVTGIMPGAEQVSIPPIYRARKGMPMTAVRAIVEHVSVDSPFTSSTPEHKKTVDLIGKRIQWNYGLNCYEHIYLNENRYTWHCVSGKAKGCADTDYCLYYRITDRLYLFVWAEKIIPVLGVLAMDMKEMRSYGKIFGYEGYDVGGRIVNFPVGSYGAISDNAGPGPSVPSE